MAIHRHRPKRKKTLQLNSQESNPKTHKIKNPEIYMCHFIINKICGKEFSLRKELQTHEKIHSEEKRFSCNLCDKKIQSESRYNAHMLAHTNYKSLSCDLCGKKLSTIDNLTRHRCGKKPYACQTCDKTYTSSSHLKRHEKSHSNQKTIICDRCNTTFIKQSDLNRHNRLSLCIITQTQADAIHSQDSADKDPNLFANTALKHAQGSSDTHKTKAAQSYELSNAPEMHACNFIINTNTNQTCPQKFSGKSNSQST